MTEQLLGCRDRLNARNTESGQNCNGTYTGLSVSDCYMWSDLMGGYSSIGQQSPLLQIDVSGDGVRQDVVLRGDLDLSTADHLQNVLHECVTRGARLTVVHMTALDFLSVAGLNVFVDAHTRLSLSGGRLVLTQPNRCALRLLQVSQLDEIITIVENPAGPDAQDSDMAALRPQLGSTVGNEVRRRNRAWTRSNEYAQPPHWATQAR